MELSIGVCNGYVVGGVSCGVPIPMDRHRAGVFHNKIR